MLCLYHLTRSVYILHFNPTLAVNPSPVNMRNCQKQLSIHVRILPEKTTPLLKNVVRKGIVCVFFIHSVETVA